MVPKGGKLNWISLPQATDMEFGRFVDFFVNVACALYLMDPVEINFTNRGGPGQSSGAIGGSSDWEARLTASKDMGLKSLLAWFARAMNRELMPWIDPENEFEFIWVGFDAKSDKEKTDLLKEQVASVKLLNEGREELGLKPLEHGDIILNPTYTGYLAQIQQQEQMAQQQAMGGQGLDNPGFDPETGEVGGDDQWNESTPGGLQEDETSEDVW